MMRIHRTTRRGMTLLELMMALAITAVVGTATVGMLNAVSVGVDTRRDHRSTMVRAHTAQQRLASYIAPSRCILARSGSNLAIWYDDSRASDTVHLSEVRWLIWNSANGTLTAYQVHFPDSMSELDRLTYDRELPLTSSWFSVYLTYSSHSVLEMRSTTIVDTLSAAMLAFDSSQMLDARHMQATLSFTSRDDVFTILAASTIRSHHKPKY